MDVFTFENGELIRVSESCNYVKLKFPISYELGKDELRPIRRVSINSIYITKSSGEKHSIHPELSPKLLVEKDNGDYTTPKMPLLLRPDSGGSNKIILEVTIDISEVGEITKDDKIVILFSQIIRTRHPITFRINGIFLNTKSFDFKIRRYKYQHIVFINLTLLFLLPTGLFSIWNSKLNNDVYSNSWLPPSSNITVLLAFVCGFFGLQLINNLQMFRSIQEVSALYKYPELYLNRATFHLFRSKIATVFLILLSIAYILTVYCHKIVALPNNEILGRDYAIIDVRDNNYYPIENKNTYSDEIQFLRIKHRDDLNNSPILFGSLTVDSSNRFCFYKKAKSYPNWFNFKILYNMAVPVNIILEGRKITTDKNTSHARDEIIAKLRGGRAANTTHTIIIKKSMINSESDKYSVEIVINEGVPIDEVMLFQDLQELVHDFYDELEIPLNASQQKEFTKKINQITPDSCLFKSEQLVSDLELLLSNIYNNQKKEGKQKLLVALGLIEVFANTNTSSTESFPFKEIEEIYYSSHKIYNLQSRYPDTPRPDVELISLYWSLLFRIEMIEPDLSERIQKMIEKVWLNTGAEYYIMLLGTSAINETLLSNTRGAELRRIFLLSKSKIMTKKPNFYEYLEKLEALCDDRTIDFLDSFKSEDFIQLPNLSFNSD